MEFRTPEHSVENLFLFSTFLPALTLPALYAVSHISWQRLLATFAHCSLKSFQPFSFLLFLLSLLTHGCPPVRVATFSFFLFLQAARCVHLGRAKMLGLLRALFVGRRG
jgi:hypothetical protein